MKSDKSIGRSDAAAIGGDTQDPSFAKDVRSSAKNSKALLAEISIYRRTVNTLQICVPAILNGTLRGQLLLDGLPLDAQDFCVTEIEERQGSSRFLVSIPHRHCDGKLHSFQFTGTLGKTRVLSSVVFLSLPSYEFEIEAVDLADGRQIVVRGWCYRQDPPIRVHLAIRDGDCLIRKTQRIIERLDVQQEKNLDVGDVMHGFEFHLDRRLLEPHCRIVLCDSITEVDIAEIFITSPLGMAREVQMHLRAVLGQAAPQLTEHIAKLSRELPLEPAFVVKSLRTYRVPDGGLDVIVPIYSDLSKTRKCLESVIAAKCDTPYRLIIVNDGSHIIEFDEIVSKLLKQQKNIIYIKNPVNEGFSKSINIGFIVAGGRDVVILNSDTIVQDGWLDRLVAVAKSGDDIGTVTPLTNNGEIVSFPRMCQVNQFPNGMAKRIDRIAQEVNRGVSVDIPVAVGFCTLIKRSCLNDVGLFDEDRWGRGYGEEVDFSLKAAELGWRNVSAVDTFVYHYGGASFGDEKAERVDVASRKLSEMYTFFDRLVQKFLVDDPLGPARRAISWQLIGQRLKDVTLHVSHSLGGGTDKYVKDTVWDEMEIGRDSIIVRFLPSQRIEVTFEVRKEHLPSGFLPGHTEDYESDELSLLISALDLLNVSRVHVHTPIHVPFLFLTWIATSFSYRVSIHDYSWVCPRVTLTQAAGLYCREPSPQKCDRCVLIYPPHPGLKPLLDECNGSVEDYRKRIAPFLQGAEKVVVGTNDVRSRLKNYGIVDNVSVEDYPRGRPSGRHQSLPVLERKSAQQSEHQIRVALIGGISDIKGFHKLIACARDAEERSLPIIFIVIGNTMNNDLCAKYSNINVKGMYTDDELPAIIETVQPHLSLFLSQWPETFCYALSHAIENRVYPIGTDLGAIGERIQKVEYGRLVPYRATAESINETILEAYGDLGSLDIVQGTGSRPWI